MYPSLSTQMIKSRKTTDLVTKSYSQVNFIAGWKLFTKLMKMVKSPGVPVHQKRISSINLHQSSGSHAGSRSVQASNSLVSRLPINRPANVGAALVPMAVPSC